MALINLERKIKVLSDSGVVQEFAAGLQEVEDEIAKHWYVVANMVGASSVATYGSNEFVTSQLLEVADIDSQIQDLEQQITELRSQREAVLSRSGTEQVNAAIVQAAQQADTSAADEQAAADKAAADKAAADKAAADKAAADKAAADKAAADKAAADKAAADKKS